MPQNEAGMELSGRTRIYGIIGDPVAHSLSPVFQSYFIDQAGLDAVYVPFHVKSGEVDKALHGLGALGVEGFNVTVPHKQTVFGMVSMDADASRIGAVNTVKRADDGWLATNTDWQGGCDVLRGLALAMEETEVLVFGAGGTARAMAHALAHLGVKKLKACNRSEERLHEFSEHVQGRYPDLNLELVAWEQDAVGRASGESALLINTTSLGLEKGRRAFPFKLNEEGMAVDAVYRPDGITPFVDAAEKAGRVAMDGLAMLVAQGAAAFGFWHNRQPAILPALRWLENKLGHQPANLPGWDGAL